MEQLHLWNIPHEQSSLLAAIRRDSCGFVPINDSGADQTIPAHFGLQVARCPNRLAVRGHRHSYTYSELDMVSNAIAAAVLEEGRRCNAAVLLFLDHDAQIVACILGVLKAGRAYVPLDPSFTGTRNSIILEDSSATTVLTDKWHYDVAKVLFGDACRIFVVDEIIGAGGQAVACSVRPDDPACVIYTSGSTGRPRGVLQTHRHILQVVKRYVNSQAVGPHDRITLLPSPTVTASVGNIFGAALSGATLLPFKVRELGFSALADWLIAEEISVYHSSPSVFRATFQSMPAEIVLPNVRIVRLGGDMAYMSDFDTFRRRVGNSSVMVNAYGCSEISNVCCFYMRSDSVITEPILPVGCPIEDMEVAVLDDSGEAVQPGMIGEIAIRSSHISPRYWNKENREQPWSPPGHEARMYRTRRSRSDFIRLLSLPREERLAGKDQRLQDRTS